MTGIPPAVSRKPANALVLLRRVVAITVASMARCVRLAAVLVCLLVSVSPAGAQGKSHGYVSFGAGATTLNAGLEVMPADRVGIGAEVGLGWAFLGALTGSYHLLRGPRHRHDLFATGGVAALGSSEFSSTGITLGGGAVLWAGRHIGFRCDGFRFVPVHTEYHIEADRRWSSVYWGASVGVAFRVR